MLPPVSYFPMKRASIAAMPERSPPIALTAVHEIWRGGRTSLGSRGAGAPCLIGSEREVC